MTRPRRRAHVDEQATDYFEQLKSNTRGRTALICVISFGFWTLVGVLSGWTVYKWRLSTGMTATFKKDLMLPLIQSWIYGVLTPFVYLLGQKYPISKTSLRIRLPAFAMGGIAFVVLHALIRMTVYPVTDPTTGIRWGLFQARGVNFQLFKNLFLYNIVDDIFTIYTPILVVAHAVIYHAQSTASSIRASELQKQLAQSKLQSLKMQLQPHFLFNTMHSISALMHSDVRAADKMMSRLSDLLRMTLETTSVQEIPLSRELEFLDKYLGIEETRFQDRVRVIMEVEPSTLEAQIPSMLLQPLVENAVRHGIARSPSGGEIKIATKKLGAYLQICISDSGPGLASGPVKGTTWPGLGLKLTRERLQQAFGCDYKFEIESKPADGFRVNVEIPFRGSPSDDPSLRVDVEEAAYE